MYGGHPWVDQPNKEHALYYRQVSQVVFFLICSFDVDWFKDHRLRRKKSLKMIPDSEMDPKVKSYLMGVHKRHNSMSSGPSSTDMASLEKAYANVSRV